MLTLLHVPWSGYQLHGEWLAERWHRQVNDCMAFFHFKRTPTGWPNHIDADQVTKSEKLDTDILTAALATLGIAPTRAT